MRLRILVLAVLWIVVASVGVVAKRDPLIISDSLYFGISNAKILANGADHSWTMFSSIVKTTDTLYGFYSTNTVSTNQRDIRIATSVDSGYTWTKNETPILTKGNVGQWDSLRISYGLVWKEAIDNWYMLYIGTRDDVHWNIGLATASNPTTWTKDVAHNPVMLHGSPGTWDSMEIVPGRNMIKEDLTYYFYYWGLTNATDQTSFKIGLATSTDLTTWIKHDSNPVLAGTPSPWTDNNAFEPDVIKFGSTYHMWYQGNTADGVNSAIFMATSTDKIHWTKYSATPVLAPTAAGWAEQWCEAPVLINIGNLWRMFYHASAGEGLEGTYADYVEDFDKDSLRDDIDGCDNRNSDGVIAYYSFDNVYQRPAYSLITFFDMVGHNDGGVYGPGPFQTGIKGRARYFDGTGTEYIVVGSTTALDTPSVAFSVSTWAKSYDTTGVLKFLFAKYYHGVPMEGWCIGLFEGHYYAQLRSGGVCCQTCNTGTMPIKDIWINIVFTYDGAKLRLYANGTIKDSSIATGTIANTQIMDIASLGAGASYRYNGLIDETTIYRKTLSPSEILTNYNKIILNGNCECSQHPVLTTLKHSMGRVGYIDTIVGSNFYYEDFSATLDTASIIINRQTNDSLIWSVPNMTRGTYNLIVRNRYGLKDSIQYRVLVPTITPINP